MDRLDFAIDGRDWPNRNASRFIDAAGLRWHVQTLGSGPALLLLHGTGASTHSWRRIAPSLSRDFTLVMPDLPGHGFTSEPPMNALTLPGMAAAVGALLRKLQIAPVAIAGHSAGAAVALRMSLDAAVAPKLIVSINGALKPFDGFPGQFFSPLAKLLFLNPFMPRLFAWRAEDPAAVRRVLEGTGSAVTEEDVALYGRLFSSPGHCAAALGMMARWDLYPLIEDLPKLAPELLLIAGDGDRAVPPQVAEKTRGLVGAGTVAFVTGAGHLAHEEKPAETAGIILSAARRTGIL